MEANNHLSSHEDARLILCDIMYRMKYAKTEMCKTDPMTDNPPLLVLAIPAEESEPTYQGAEQFREEVGTKLPYNIVLCPLTMSEDVGDALMQFAKNAPPIKFAYLFVACEGYGRKDLQITPEDATKLGTRSLEEEFRNNPFTDVREAQLVTGINWDGDLMWHSISTYTYDDHGVPMFDEDENTEANLTDDSDHGRIPDIMRAVATFMRMVNDMDGFSDLLRNARRNEDDK